MVKDVKWPTPKTPRKSTTLCITRSRSRSAALTSKQRVSTAADNQVEPASSEYGPGIVSSYNKNIDFEVLVPHIQSLPVYKGYKNLLNPLPLPRSSFNQNICIRALEAKVDVLMKKVAGLEVDNNNMAAMIATITSQLWLCYFLYLPPRTL